MMAVPFPLQREARFTSVFEAGRFLGALHPQGIWVEDAHALRLFPALFVLNDVLVIPPDWSVLTDDGRLIVDGIAINPYLIRKGRFPAVQPTGGEACALTLEVGDPIDEPVFFVGGDCMGNYYHWLVDFFPRLVAFLRLRPRLRALGILRIALLQDPPEVVFALLAHLGLREEDVLWIDGNQPRPVRFLALLSNVSQYGYIHPFAVETLRAEFPPPPGAGTAKRALYVSRRDANARRVRNEDELTAALATRGIETVVPGALSFDAQRRLFAEACVIVGPHGAGLTNMLFAPPGARVVELWPNAPPLRHFALLARASGHRFTALRAARTDAGLLSDHNADFHADPMRVLTALESLENEEETNSTMS
jgi:hypothetical protein